MNEKTPCDSHKALISFRHPRRIYFLLLSGRIFKDAGPM